MWEERGSNFFPKVKYHNFVVCLTKRFGRKETEAKMGKKRWGALKSEETGVGEE